MGYFKMKKILSFFGVFVVTTSILSGCSLLPKEESNVAPPLVKPQKQEYNLYKIVKKAIVDDEEGSATFVSSDTYSICFKDQGKRVNKIDVKVGDSVKNGQTLIESDQGSIATDIQMEEYNVEKQQIMYNEAKEKNNADATELARLDLLMEQTKLQALKKQQADNLLTSPVDGVVSYVADLKQWDNVDPYKTLVTVSNPNKVFLQYQPSNTTRAKVGMKVNITYNNKTYIGTVISTPDSSTSTAKTSTTDDSSSNSYIKISMSDAIPGAKLNDTATISIIIESKASTIVVPKRAVKSIAGSYVVDLWDGKKKQEVTVKPGITDATEMEILSGLSEGQNAILY